MALLLPTPTTKPTTPVLNRSHRLAQGLRGAWLFSEGGGDVLRDFVEGNYGTLTNMAPSTDWVNTTDGSALAFDGVNDHVVISQLAEDPTEFTIFMRARPTAADDRCLFTRTNADGPTLAWSHQLRMENGTAEGYIYDGSAKYVSGGPTLTSTKFWNLGVTAKNGSPLTLYVDGQIEGTTSNIGTMWTSGDRWFMASETAGNFGWEHKDYFQGDISLCLLWYRALSAGEMQELHSDPWGMWRQPSRWVYSAQEAAGGFTPTSPSSQRIKMKRHGTYLRT